MSEELEEETDRAAFLFGGPRGRHRNEEIKQKMISEGNDPFAFHNPACLAGGNHKHRQPMFGPPCECECHS